MITFILPTEKNKADILSFYGEFEKEGEVCIGIGNYKNSDCWLAEMQNRHMGLNLPKGYVRENFYLCYNENKLVGVFSLKFELTEFLLNYGGHIGYAVRPSERNCGLATEILKQGLKLSKKFGFERVLCVCDDDNYASERVILKNGGTLENRLYDPIEKGFVKRYWIEPKNLDVPGCCG